MGKQRLAHIKLDTLTPDPVRRLSYLIKTKFWPALTRRLDEDALDSALTDDKNTRRAVRRIYVPRGAMDQYHYYQTVAQRRPDLNLEVHLLPQKMTHDLYRQMNAQPGILALDMEDVPGSTNSFIRRGLPYVVPGGRFNELYNWDSYFIALGLLKSGRFDLVESLIKNFIFEIQHYGLIPNANRSYYLLRSQPPFLTNLAIQWFRMVRDDQAQNGQDVLIAATAASIKEYHKVWMSEPRLDPKTKLSRFRPDGVASPPECRTSHFGAILKPFAEKHGLSVQEFRDRYDAGQISEPELDTYFLHDRAVRESGHDVSSRTEHVCADLAIVDLNSLLYKYETDIAHVITDLINTKNFLIPDIYQFEHQNVEQDQQAQVWLDRAATRKEAMHKYLWSADAGLYKDYNTLAADFGKVESVTSLWPLWSGTATKEQAASLVPRALQLFECVGGLSSTPEDRRGDKDTFQWQVEHQWDYPFGWAPHQVMAWDGLLNYGYRNEAQRVAYKWLLVILTTFVEQNGCVVEKYNVTTLSNSQIVDADYGNQGIDFEYYPKEGFGWTNASFVYGLDILSAKQRTALSLLAPWSDSLL